VNKVIPRMIIKDESEYRCTGMQNGGPAACNLGGSHYRTALLAARKFILQLTNSHRTKYSNRAGDDNSLLTETTISRLQLMLMGHDVRYESISFSSEYGSSNPQLFVRMIFCCQTMISRRTFLNSYHSSINVPRGSQIEHESSKFSTVHSAISYW
jgi:hypothetical protein